MKRYKVGLSYSTFRREVKNAVERDMNRLYEPIINNAAAGLNTNSNMAFVNLGTECNIGVASYLTHDADSLVDVTNEDFSYSENIEESFLSGDDSDSDVVHDTIRDQLGSWAVRYGVTHASLAALLSILKPHFDDLPSDPKTLLKTPRNCIVRPLGTDGSGDYCYLGVVRNLQLAVSNVSAVQEHTLQLQFNIDGLQLFKSTKSTLWAILCLVKNINLQNPFLVSMYYGTEKPMLAKEFLEKFVSEMCELLRNGFVFNNVHYSVNIHCFVCDAPARAFVKGIKMYSGYNSCEKCTLHGEHIGKIIFPNITSSLRTDESFAAMTDQDHHKEACPLLPLPVGYVSQFGLDYMHLVCLGVVHKLILYWKGLNGGPLKVRLGRLSTMRANERMLCYASYMPTDFARRPRSLDEVQRWKATEFRQFLLYTGMAALRNCLNDDLYKHFLLLSVAITLLVDTKLSLSCNSYSENLLVRFVKESEILYTRDILVYNIHCLIHLPSDVRSLGKLDSFSAFPFENKLRLIKNLVRKPQLPMQQIVRRIAEQCNMNRSSCMSEIRSEVHLEKEHFSGIKPRHFGLCKQYKKVTFKDIVIQLNGRDNCIIVSPNLPVIVQNIIQQGESIVLICTGFKEFVDFF